MASRLWQAIQREAKSNIVPYTRCHIYGVDFIRPFVLFIVWFVAPRLFGEWVSYNLNLVIIGVGFLLGCLLSVNSVLRIVLVLTETLFCADTLAVTVFTQKATWVSLHWFAQLVPLFELVLWFVGVVLIRLLKSPFWLKRKQIVFVSLAVFVAFTLVVGAYPWTSEFDSENFWQNNAAFYGEIYRWGAILVEKWLNEIILLLTLVAMLWFIPKKNAYYSTWMSIYPELLKQFGLWVCMEPALGDSQSVRGEGTIEAGECPPVTRTEIEHEIDSLVLRGADGHVMFVWQLLKYFRDKRDSSIRGLIVENNLKPLLLSEGDGDNTVDELFASAIVHFAVRSRSATSSLVKRFWSFFGGDGVDEWQVWRTYYALQAPVSPYRYDILERVYIECVRKGLTAKP